MKLGLLGFPSSGKTTLFRLLTGASVDSAPAGKDPFRVGVARVPDPRIDHLVKIFRPKKITRSTVEFLDPTAVRGAARREAAPYQEIRTADGFLHVLRAFADPSVPIPEGGVDPARDVRGMETELLLADLVSVEKRLEKLEISVRKNRNPDDQAEREILERVRAGLEKERPVRQTDLRPEERKKVRGFDFLTDKPILGFLNLDEADCGNPDAGLRKYGLEAGGADQLHAGFCAASARIELEVNQLDPGDAEEFRKDLGITDSCRDQVIRGARGVLDQATFFTCGETEVRAWDYPASMVAQKVAGRIHSDMERGFIRAEVIAYKDLMEAGSMAAARERGTLRMEGRDYPVLDGDIITFRFHV